jgi:hypothetical protein
MLGTAPRIIADGDTTRPGRDQTWQDGGVRALAAGCAVLLGCGGGLEIDGAPGTVVAAVFEASIPYAPVRIDGHPERLLLLDTGAPVTVLDASAYPDLGDGAHEVEVATLGVTFRGATVASWSLAGGGLGAGLLGADLVRHFALTLDYRDARLWITRPYDARVRPPDLATGAEVVLGAEVRGGGRARLPGCGGTGCGTLAFAATRFMVRVTLEGRPAPVWAIVDTGASGVVLDESLLAELPGDGRPRLDGVVVVTSSGLVPAFLSRVWRVGLEGADGASARVAVDDQPVIVIPGSDLLADLSREVGVDTRALIGGQLLRHHLTTIDYPGSALRLAPYGDLSHIPAGEFVGVGFALRREGDDWRVREVYPGRDAFRKGLRPDHLIDELDGTPIRGLPGEAVDAILDAFALGAEVPVVYRAFGVPQAVRVLVEDLLPSFPPP